MKSSHNHRKQSASVSHKLANGPNQSKAFDQSLDPVQLGNYSPILATMSLLIKIPKDPFLSIDNYVVLPVH